jgi:hypothetical protein
LDSPTPTSRPPTIFFGRSHRKLAGQSGCRIISLAVYGLDAATPPGLRTEARLVTAARSFISPDAVPTADHTIVLLYATRTDSTNAHPV